MTDTAKPTKGPVEFNGYSITDGVIDIARVYQNFGVSGEEFDANGRLIAEAFNARTETGRTPRQLADERIELLVALHNIAAIEDALNGGNWDEIEHARSIARAIIAKVEPKP